MKRAILPYAVVVVLALAQSGLAQKSPGNLVGQTDRPLRYTPDNGDFVIESRAGKGESFNRPLYGSNTAFRVDAGDLPEFMVYLPTRGGNLRLGVRVGEQAKWFNGADRVVARYHAGMMLYEIHDALLGGGSVQIAAVPLHEQEGIVLKIDGAGVPAGAELIWALGGSDGLAGNRRGDIGAESSPVAQFFQVRPENCRNNRVTAEGAAFTLIGATRTVRGMLTGEGVVNAQGDGTNWGDAGKLLGAAVAGETATPVAMGHAPLAGGTRYLSLERVIANRAVLKAEDLAKACTAARESREKIASALVVDTPDPYINASASALCIAADACWDEAQGAMMHGAVAWRNKLLGWRGPYALDIAGWHDRELRHLTYWAGQQIIDPNIPAAAHADAAKNLATDDWKMLHSDGAMSKSHYDMNLAYVDAYMRYALWTGDTAFLKKTWPVLQRHLAWEQRCFRRVFKDPQTGEDLPLYEAYAAIWASDNLQYDGGGTAHASALNYYHNLMAARIAKIIGEDGSAYQKEADLILKGMDRLLWVPGKGVFGESKDLLGRQGVHDAPAVWSVYHVIDSRAADPVEAYRMCRYVDTQIAHLPVGGAGVPAGSAIVASSNWMPYMWSLNNFCLGENAATGLAQFQARKPAEGFAIYKGNVLDSMFMGLCPGNTHMSSQFDLYRAESQRDFADPTAMMMRCLVEGLFGIQPDLLAGEVTLAPGFPEAWDHASIRQADVRMSFQRQGRMDRFEIVPQFPRPVTLRLRLPAREDHVAAVTVNGAAAQWHAATDAVGAPALELTAPAAGTWQVSVTWGGAALAAPRPLVSEVEKMAAPGAALSARIVPDPAHGGAVAELRQGDFSWRLPLEAVAAPGAVPAPPMDWKSPLAAGTKLDAVDLSSVFNAEVTSIFKTEYVSPRSPHVSLAIPKQGLGGWADNKATATIDDSGLRTAAGRNAGTFAMPNGVTFKTPAEGRNIAFTSFWDNHPREISVPLAGSGRHLYLLMAGTTNPMRSHIENGEVVAAYADGTSAVLALRNPATWWPIEQDYLLDDYSFSLGQDAVAPPRVDLRTGAVRFPARTQRGGSVNGGAATVLDLRLDPSKTLKSLTVRASTYEVIIGLMAATVER